MEKTMNVADFVAEALALAGVTHVFGGHGGAVVPLIESITKHPKLTWVYMRNEGNASMAAHAAAKLNPKIVGCCLATSGPGCTNLTTGLVCGKMDSVPMIAITGLKPSYKNNLVDFQDIENDRLFAGILEWSKRVVHPFQAPQLMRDALAYALSRRTCVHIAFPEDIQEAILDTCHQRFLNAEVHPLPSVAPPMSAVDITCDFLCERADKRILILVGHLAVHVGPEITELAETLNAPIVTRLDAKGVIDETHPLCCGVAGVHGFPGLARTRDVIESSDCVISIGVEDQMLAQNIITGGMQNRELVYIMPDQATVTGQFITGASLIGDIADSLKLLTKQLKAKYVPEKARNEGGFPDIFMFWQNIKNQGWRNTKAEPLVSVEPTPGSCHPSYIYNALNQHLGPEDTLCVDTGDQTLWAASLGRLSKGTRTISDEFMGTMGYALPAAISMSLHKPTGTHVVVVGDGAAQMSINELASAKQFRSRIVMIVFVNNVLGRVRYGFGPSEVPGTEIDTPDFVAVAKAYGGDGVHVRDSHEAQSAVETAFTREGLFLIEVQLDRHLSAHMETFRAGDHELMQFTLDLSDLLPEHMKQLRRPVAMHHLMDITNKDLELARKLLRSYREDFESDSKSYEVPRLDAYLMRRIWSHDLHTRLNREDILSVKGPVLLAQPISADFPGTAPMRLLKDATNLDLPTNWVANMQKHIPDLVDKSQWASFAANGTSNSRTMSWVVITIPPNKSFPLHAHPSLELIYVAQGVLHETRIDYDHEGKAFDGHMDCLDLGHVKGQHILERTFRQDEMLFNDIGSIHRSYTKDEGVVLLCLWSGGHTRVVGESEAHSDDAESHAHELAHDDCCLRHQPAHVTMT